MGSAVVYSRRDITLMLNLDNIDNSSMWSLHLLMDCVNCTLLPTLFYMLYIALLFVQTPTKYL